MNIPALELSKYLTKSTDKLPNKPSISYLITPPTSPADSENPNLTSNKRTLDDDSKIPSTSLKKTKTDIDKNGRILDLNLLDLYLSSGRSMKVKDNTYGLNLLCWACQCKSIKAVKKVIQQGDININERNGPHRITALHLAAAVDFFDGIDCLTQHPDLDLNVEDIFGLTAIHYAAKHSKNNAMRTLLKVGARLDLYDRYGRLALHYAIRNSNIEFARLILSSKNGSNNPTLTNLIWSSRNGYHCTIEEAIIMSVVNQSKILKEFTDAGMFVPIELGGWWEEEYENKRDGLIELCIEWNRFECLRYLVVNTNIPLTRQALELAVRQRKLDFVKYLCDVVGISPCQENGNNQSLLYAANHGFMEMIPYLFTPDTSSDCIEQATRLTKLIGKYKMFCDILKSWKPTDDKQIE